MTKPEPICADCEHMTLPGAYVCSRVRCAITGNAMSCHAERSEANMSVMPRVPVGDARCGPYGIHFMARVANDA